MLANFRLSIEKSLRWSQRVSTDNFSESKLTLLNLYEGDIAVVWGFTQRAMKLIFVCTSNQVDESTCTKILFFFSVLQGTLTA